MKAKICDRCKKVTTELKIKDFKLIRVSQTPSRYNIVLDLCPECQSSLTEWFNSLEKGKEEQETASNED